MRTGPGRRFLEIYDLTAGEFPFAEAHRVREVALLKFELEKAQQAGTISLEDLVRTSNAIVRREKELRKARPHAEAAQPQLHHYLKGGG